MEIESCKIRVTPEQSHQIQQICFENGLEWADGNKDIQALHAKYLYVDNKKLRYTYNAKEYFISVNLPEISSELFLIKYGNTNSLRNKMKTQDLKTGMRVVLRNEREFIVMLNTELGDILYDGINSIELKEYNENFNNSKLNTHDIMEVYSINTNEDGESNILLYEVKETAMTIQEIEKLLGVRNLVIKNKD